VEPLYKRALTIREKALGTDHPDVALSLNNLADLYDQQGRYADAEPLYKRSLAIREKALGLDHPDVASSLNNLASLYQNQGRYADAEPLYKRSLAIWEKALGPDHPSIATSLNNLAILYDKQGRYADAEPLYQRALAINEQAFGHDHPTVALSLNNLAGLNERQGRYTDAELLYKRALEISQKALDPNHIDVAVSLSNLGKIYLNQGRYADAELLVKRSLEIYEKAFGPDHPHFATLVSNLGEVYRIQGRYADAEPLIKRAFAIREKALGPNHPDVAGSLKILANLYQNQKKYVDAEPLIKRALAIYEKAFGPDHPYVATFSNELALLYELQGRYSDAEPLLKRALITFEKALGPDHPHVATSLNSLALLYDKQGRYADAEPLYKHSLELREKTLGPNHPYVATSLNNLAGLYRDQGRYADAYAYIRRTFSNKLSEKIPSFPVILGSQRSRLLTPEQSFADSYNVLQFTSSSAAAEAVQKLAQRYAAGTDELAKLVRHNQDLIAETSIVDKALINAISKEPKQRIPSDEDRMRARLSEIRTERLQIETALTQSFPDYVALSRPQPLTLIETQALLSDDEAIVVIDIGDLSYAWVITKTSADWTDIPASSKILNDQVAMLRQSLTNEVDKPFDAALAYRIYQETLDPVANHLVGKRRISVITNGALTAIPLQLLVTKDPAGKTLKDVDWLVKSYAITVIPSIYSLNTMRAQKPQSTAPKAMIAFADPVFSKTARKEAQKVALRSMTNFYSGTQINIQALAESLPQLPSTRAEVLNIAKTLNVPASDIHLGLEATVTAVKKAPLDQYRIVYFATHALVTGDLKAFAQAKAEPALALTIPDKPTDQDDGLLPMSEISELKLNADWVVLSACNTAASDGVGAEALSGLARAFFYAGTRSLIVSHWDVLDEETVQLMSDLFKINSQNKSLSHGEALRQAQLDMLNNAKNDDQAHPRVWAPFVVVGEPMKLQ
jgi:CHAT domain-containing protein/Tfp pilus assembly protein PilF